MNLRQKLYDAQDAGNVLMKINNSSALYKNLEEIKSRKPIYSNISKSQRRKNNSYKQSDYYRRQENKIFGKILIDIRDKDDNSLYIILFQLYHII
jgi:hypothetical protein